MQKKVEKDENNNLNEKNKNNMFSLILFNDDYNTFDWVVKCLIKICKHEHTQAVQCAYITHYKGKCEIKTGDCETLYKYKKKLLMAGLNVIIELKTPLNY